MVDNRLQLRRYALAAIFRRCDHEPLNRTLHIGQGAVIVRLQPLDIRDPFRAETELDGKPFMLVPLIAIVHQAGDRKRTDFGKPVRKRLFERLRHCHERCEHIRLMAGTPEKFAQIAKALHARPQHILNIRGQFFECQPCDPLRHVHLPFASPYGNDALHPEIYCLHPGDTLCV